MVDAEQVQNGSVQVVAIGGLVNGSVGPFIAFAVRDPAFDAAAASQDVKP